MRIADVRELFRALTARYFTKANVIYAKQSRVAKTEIPLVAITYGNVKRSRDSIKTTSGGASIGAYPSRVSTVVDLFTHGSPVKDDVTGTIIAYENTAVDDMLAFADFLGSEYVVDWSNRNDVAIVIDGDVQDLTGLVNDNNYEFRSRLNIMIYFTHYTVGTAAVLSESSIQYPTGEVDEFGEPVYSPVEPPKTISTTGYHSAETDTEGEIPDYVPPEIVVPQPVVIPIPEVTPSGGGSEELAQQETGYFNEVEFKEETGNE